MIQRKSTCGKEKELYKSVTAWIKDFHGHENLIGKQYWIGVVDDNSRSSWSFFTKTKSQLPKNMEEFFEKMMPHGIPVKYIRCDIAGEH